MAARHEHQSRRAERPVIEGVSTNHNLIGNHISSDIDLRRGRRWCFGKSNVNRSDEPLVLVVTAKVVE